MRRWIEMPDLVHFFVLLHVLAGHGSLWFTVVSPRSETKTRRIANLPTITANHREIWKVLFDRPELNRVLDASADVIKQPVARAEELFVNMIIPAAGGAAHSGASLDVDDVAGETDQDRGEGRAPFLEDSLPDGGGGGSARVVPGYSRRDWPAEISNRTVRMKKETQQSQGNTGNHGRGVFASGRKWALGAKSGIETALCQRITGTDWKKILANRWNRKRITKKAHAVVGWKPYGKSQPI